MMCSNGAADVADTGGNDEPAKVPLLGVSNAELSFSLLGCKDFPLIEVELEPGCSLCAEPGRLIQLPAGVHFETVMGDGTPATIFQTMGKAMSRMFSGESVTLARFTNNSGSKEMLRLGTVIPGNLVPLDLSDYGGSLIGMGGVYLCGSDKLKIESCFRQSLGAAFFGGESFILQKITGDGVVILQGGGVVMKEQLTPTRRTIKVDTGCLVAFTDGLEYKVAVAEGGLKSWFFGEGLFFATITLPEGQSSGTVWVESFPYNRFIHRIKGSYVH